jgi:hypothetical protein
VTNPSGYITGVNLSSYATIGFVTGISGYLQPQITNLNNQTGSYVTGSVVRPSETGVFITQSQTGQFYAASNPSGFITGVDLSAYITGINNIVYTTGNQDISGLKDFQTRPTVLDIPVLVSGDAVDTIHLYGKNDQGSTIYKGQPVYINGANGANPLIKLASNTGERTSSKTIGLLSQDLSVNAFGYIITEGLLEGFNTSAGAAGDPMWLGTTGNIIYGTGNKPYGNNHLVFLGFVLRSNNNNGKVYVKVQNGFEIEELHKVYAINPSDKDTLVYNSGSGAWFARQLNTGDVSGISDYVLNSATGAFYASSNPSGYITGINNIIYTTGNQNISGVKTFGDNVGIGTTSPSAKLHAVSTTEQLRVGYDASNYMSATVNASGLVTLDAVGSGAAFAFSDPVTATAQPALSASTAKGVVTNELFDERAMEIKVSFLQTVVAAAATIQTQSQFLTNYGSMNFVTPVANDAGIYASFLSPTISLHGNDLSNNNAGGGPMIDWRVNHILGFDLITFKGATARDAIARVVLGNVATSGTNSARLGALASSSGYGIKMSKHPVNNTYQIQLVGRTCNSNNTNISGATNASPIVITYNSHNHQNGDLVEITGVGGNTAANGIFTISGVTTNTFVLDGSTGNGAYTSGGACQKISSEIIEVNPYTFYKFFIKYNYASRTITLHLGTPSAAASLTLTGLGVAQNATTHQLGTNIKIGMMAGADITGVGSLGINFNNPYIMTNRY